jgi:hypothetical protein
MRSVIQPEREKKDFFLRVKKEMKKKDGNPYLILSNAMD